MKLRSLPCKLFSYMTLAACFMGTPDLGIAADKVALVIGVSAYENGPDLKTPVSDSTAIAQRLSDLGYDTVLVQNAKRAELMTALAELRLRAQEAEKVIIYFAGHGVLQAGQTYVLSTDSEFSGPRARQSMTSLRVMIRAISDKPRQKFIFIDACRENPAYHSMPQVDQSSKSWGTPAGLFTLFAAQPGAPAFDGADGISPFAKAVLTHIEQDDPIEVFARKLRVDVIRQTRGQQIPWSQSSLLRPAFLNGPFPQEE